VIHEQEILERIGTVGRFAVYIVQHDLDPDLTEIVLETPDGRTWGLDGEDAGQLAAWLAFARLRLSETIAAIEAVAGDDED
jgi:hypothetical protein